MRIGVELRERGIGLGDLGRQQRQASGPDVVLPEHRPDDGAAEFRTPFEVIEQRGAIKDGRPQPDGRWEQFGPKPGLMEMTNREVFAVLRSHLTGGEPAGDAAAQA